MKKTVIAGLTAIALAGSSASFAQQTPAPQGEEKQEHHHLGPADLKALTDARIAALKVGLELTPEQEKNWSPVAQAVRYMAQAKQARRAEWREHGKNEDSIAKLRARAGAMTERAAELKNLAEAAEPLYRSLTEEQKHRLPYLIRATMWHGHHHGEWHHHG